MPAVEQERVFLARSYTLAMALMARGYSPIRAEIARDNGTVIFIFPVVDQQVLDTYHEQKRVLDRLRLEATCWPR